MDINEQIYENTGLIYKQLVAFNLRDDQDAESFAYEALYRAIITYNSDNGVAFSTYAVCCINNALRKHLRTLGKKRQLKVVSYDAPVSDCSDSCSLADIIEYPISVEDTLISEEASNILLQCAKAEYLALSVRHRKVIEMFYTDENATQKEIATSVGVTQATVSKIVSAFRHHVKLRMEEYE